MSWSWAFRALLMGGEAGQPGEQTHQGKPA